MNTQFPRLLLMTSLLVSSIQPTRAEDGDIQRGQQLYTEQMCNLCHTLAGESGTMAQVGGSLDNLAAKRDANWVKQYIRDPKSLIPNSVMPKSELSDQAIADLAAFLLAH